MSRDKITLPLAVSADDLASALSRDLSYDALLKLFRNVDKLIADWGFTKKVHAYFDTEMRVLAEEEGRPLPKPMPEPWTRAQMDRLYRNSPELVGADTGNLSMNEWAQICIHIEKCHGIRPDKP